MDVLYVCNEKIQKNYMLEVIFNKICTINNVDPYVKSIPRYSKKINRLNNNLFLLLNKARKITVFE